MRRIKQQIKPNNKNVRPLLGATSQGFSIPTPAATGLRNLLDFELSPAEVKIWVQSPQANLERHPPF